MSSSHWVLESTGPEYSSIEITGTLVVGRTSEAGFVLPSPHISRRHAELLLRDQALYVRDLGSANGTFVNDRRIDGEVALLDGDVVRFDLLGFRVAAPMPAFVPTVTRPVVSDQVLAQASAAPPTLRRPSPSSSSSSSSSPSPSPARQPRPLRTAAELRAGMETVAVEHIGAAVPANVVVKPPSPGVGKATAAELVLELLDGSVVVVPLSNRDVRLGRGPDNDFVLQDGSVSAHHAVVLWRDNGWVLRDAASRNGCFVNGVPSTEVALQIGDTVVLGLVRGQVQARETPELPFSRLQGLGISRALPPVSGDQQEGSHLVLALLLALAVASALLAWWLV